MTVSRRLPPPPAGFRPLGDPLQHGIPYAVDAATLVERQVQDGLAAARGAVRLRPAGWLALAFGLGLLLASRRAH
ncbi:hypothetical protein [Roseomonas sp. 18066]|uniref:hypothetical protein n=1 Tax=Roseomonas sp. 18066 TaxID=2681412 RepID=UPI00135C93E7|nr:hypothetical protein [Roseomonas sp. 18066]